MKENTEGTPEVENTDLHFVHGKQSVQVSASPITSVSTGAYSRAAVGKTDSTLSMAAPYGSGRVLALFRSNINKLTIQYRDSAGVLHSDIFTLPTGTAETVKRELISRGAHTHTGQAEFLVALYEMIYLLEKHGFSPVYRVGERNAATVDDRVVLHSIVRGFKRGSETMRKVTTVAGDTSITVHCQLTRPDGTPVLERDIVGNVRLFGANRRRPIIFAKRRLT